VRRPLNGQVANARWLRPNAQYTFTNLGIGFIPNAVNIHDQVVGSVPTVQSNGLRSGRVWDNGQAYRPDDLVPHVGSDYGPDLNDINDAGRIAGSASTGTFMAHAAWWQAGQTAPHDAGSLRAISQGIGIDAAGDVLAATDDQMGGTQRMQLSPGGSSVRQVGANDRNIVPCGISDTGAILARDIDAAANNALLLFANPDATPTPLTGIGYVGCGPSYYPPYHGISPAGAIVGNDAQGNVILRDTAGTLHNLTAGKPASASYRPYAIVGDVIVGQGPGAGGAQAAVAWLDGEWVDLNRFAPTGVTLTSATDVNANGDIVGTGKFAGQDIGFLLRSGASPPPPPPPPPATTLAPFDYPKLPPAADPNTRLLSIKNLLPGVGPRVYVTRAGKTYLAGADATFEKGDRIRTDANTVLTLEFLIGGRADVNRDTEVEIVNDRGVAQNRVGFIRMILNTGKLVVDLVTPDRHKNYIWDLEIQTNGGTTGIKG
jgi:hypothetical protein